MPPVVFVGRLIDQEACRSAQQDRRRAGHLPYVGPEVARAEPTAQHGAARKRRHQEDRHLARQMIDRERRVHRIVTIALAAIDAEGGVELAPRHDDAFRRAGCAARIDHGRNVRHRKVRFALNAGGDGLVRRVTRDAQRRRWRVRRQLVQQDHRFKMGQPVRDGADCREEFGNRDSHAGPAVFQDIGEHLAMKFVVDRNFPGLQPGNRLPGDMRPDALRHHDRDPGVFPDTGRFQRRDELPDPPQEARISRALAVYVFKIQPVRDRFRAPVDRNRQRKLQHFGTRIVR